MNKHIVLLISMLFIGATLYAEVVDRCICTDFTRGGSAAALTYGSKCVYSAGYLNPATCAQKSINSPASRVVTCNMVGTNVIGGPLPECNFATT